MNLIRTSKSEPKFYIATPKIGLEIQRKPLNDYLYDVYSSISMNYTKDDIHHDFYLGSLPFWLSEYFRNIFLLWTNLFIGKK